MPIRPVHYSGSSITGFMGIDPGASGGIAMILGSAGGDSVTFKSMPDSEPGVWDLVQMMADPVNKVFACIEWITPAFFGAGKASMSKLYGSYKALRMALVAADIAFEDVKTAQWARALDIPPRKRVEGRAEWKNRLKARAEELFPGLKITLATADALLIAEYCRRIHGDQ